MQSKLLQFSALTLVRIFYNILCSHKSDARFTCHKFQILVEGFMIDEYHNHAFSFFQHVWEHKRRFPKFYYIFIIWPRIFLKILHYFAYLAPHMRSWGGMVINFTIIFLLYWKCFKPKMVINSHVVSRRI